MPEGEDLVQDRIRRLEEEQRASQMREVETEAKIDSIADSVKRIENTLSEASKKSTMQEWIIRAIFALGGAGSVGLPIGAGVAGGGDKAPAEIHHYHDSGGSDVGNYWESRPPGGDRGP